uniref:Uncharacterized protein n=1 Tax=Arundo donax TaxID=35708 RepID=A0A0A9HAW8_ARUDO
MIDEHGYMDDLSARKRGKWQVPSFGCLGAREAVLGTDIIPRRDGHGLVGDAANPVTLRVEGA